MLPVDKAAPNASSVFYDGVIVAGGADAGKIAAMGLVKAFLAETFKFGKTIAALTDAAPVVAAAHLPGVGARGAPKLGVFINTEVTDAFVEAMKTPRFRNRDVEAVAAKHRSMMAAGEAAISSFYSPGRDRKKRIISRLASGPRAFV